MNSLARWRRDQSVRVRLGSALHATRADVNPLAHAIITLTQREPWLRARRLVIRARQVLLHRRQRRRFPAKLGAQELERLLHQRARRLVPLLSLAPSVRLRSAALRVHASSMRSKCSSTSRPWTPSKASFHSSTTRRTASRGIPSPRRTGRFIGEPASRTPPASPAPRSLVPPPSRTPETPPCPRRSIPRRRRPRPESTRLSRAPSRLDTRPRSSRFSPPPPLRSPASTRSAEKSVARARARSSTAVSSPTRAAGSKFRSVIASSPALASASIVQNIASPRVGAVARASFGRRAGIASRRHRARIARASRIRAPSTSDARRSGMIFASIARDRRRPVEVTVPLLVSIGFASVTAARDSIRCCDDTRRWRTRARSRARRASSRRR